MKKIEGKIMKYTHAVKVIHTAGNVENVETLLRETTLQIGLGETNLCTMKGKSSIILDFGKEVSGGARILTFVMKNAQKVKELRL